MDTARKRSAGSYWALLAAVILAAGGCSAPRAHTPTAPAPLRLTAPSRVSANAISLAVGTNRWPQENALLAETFLPVAVTVHNASNRPICGDVARAVLRDGAGASVSASSPQGVVERLFGPLALQDLSVRVTPSAAVPAEHGARLLLIRGGRGGGMPSGRSYGPRAFRPSPYGFGSPSFRPSPYSFGSPPLFPSPFASPGFPYPYSPLPPFTHPFPPSYPHPYPFPPYGYAPSYPNPYPLFPYGYAIPFPPEERPSEKVPSAEGHALMTQIFSLAFATLPLATQEERSGFLFFPLPIPSAGPTQLDWGWYDCATRELVAQLAVPVVVPRQT